MHINGFENKIHITLITVVYNHFFLFLHAICQKNVSSKFAALHNVNQIGGDKKHL